MVSAQDTKPLTKEELAELYRQARDWNSYRIDFRVTFGEGKEAQKLEGRYEKSGAGFHITTPEVELFSDGVTKWEVSRLYKEIVIDVLSADDRAILANPAQFFDQLGRGVAIEVLSIVPHIIPGPEFRFDAARYPGFEVVDFR
jgi:hypothetical protein